MNITPTPAAQLQVPENTRIPQQTMDQSDFLDLLITQLANQNPLKPTDGNEMLAQMTQIASIQSMTSMQSAMTNLKTNQQLTLGQSLLNKTVDVYSSELGSDVIGTVDKVSVLEDTAANGSRTQTVSLNIGGSEYPITALVSVLSTPTN